MTNRHDGPGHGEAYCKQCGETFPENKDKGSSAYYDAKAHVYNVHEDPVPDVNVGWRDEPLEDSERVESDLADTDQGELNDDV